jgi:N-acyl-D-amino-acid deacylase
LVDFDVLIKNATIVEGTGKEPYKGSIAIEREKIVELGKIKGKANQVIDAKGLTAIPGFIDCHSHADHTILWYPYCENYIMQGCTTFIGGQCGGSMAPLSEFIRPDPVLSDHLVDLDPFKYYPNQSYYKITQINQWMEELYGWTLDWKTMAQFFNKVEKKGISMNFAPLVGHGTIRTHVMGLDYKRHATDSEVAEMRSLIEEAMDDGCIGMSAGRDYDPDYFASNSEMIDGVRVVKKYDGIFTIHALSTGRRRGVTPSTPRNNRMTGRMLDIEVYKETGVPIHWAHLSVGWQTIPWLSHDKIAEANTEATIEILTKPAKNELDITWDAIPFMARGGWNSQPYLASLLAPWCREYGSREELGRWLRSRDVRQEIKDAVNNGKWYMGLSCNPSMNPDWADNIYIIKSKIPGLDGRALSDIAQQKSKDPWETFFDILIEDPDTRINIDIIGVKEWQTQAYNKMLGLDFRAFDVGYEGKNPPYTIPGVYAYSAFPMFINKYVRDSDTFTWDMAVQATSGKAARVHGLEGRGVLAEGGYGDIVLLDVPRLRVLGTELEPRRYPEGVVYVLVNGAVAVDKGKHMGTKTGQILKKHH